MMPYVLVPRAVGASFCLALVLAAPAAAQQAPPCGPNTASVAELAAPAEVAFGREGLAFLNESADFDVVFEPAAPGGTLSTAYTRRFPAQESYNAEFPVSFRQGDGPARLRVTYEDTAYAPEYAPSYRCMRTHEAVIQPVEGRMPRVRRMAEYGESLEVWLSFFSPCALMRTGAYTLRVRGGRSRTDLRLRDACGGWRPRMVRDFSADFTAGDDEAHPSMTLTPRKRSENVTRGYSVTVHFRGRRLRTIRFRVRWSYKPRRRIDEAEDDFVNVCINDPDISIWKKNGRLYCVEPAHREARVTVLP